MANVAANIIVGEPTSILIGAYGAAEGACTAVGYTEGGAQIMPNSEFYRKKADQAVGVLGVVLTGREPILKFNMAEGQLQNLQWAMGYDAGGLVDSTNLDIGGSKTVDEYAIYMNTPGPGAGATRKYTIHKAVSIGNPEVSHVKDDKVIYACEFLILQDTSKAEDKQFVEIDDSGVDTTAPTVVLTTPAEDGTVAKDALSTVTLTFTEAGAGIDEGTLIDGTTIMILNVTDQTQNVKVAGTWVYTAAGKTLVFTPTANWTGSDKICVIITTSVKDMAGNALAVVYVGNFTVAA